jgi:L-threonylcarbamoyladenylate synthase
MVLAIVRRPDGAADPRAAARGFRTAVRPLAERAILRGMPTREDTPFPGRHPSGPPVLPGDDLNSIAVAAKRLRGGGLVVFPTETVYGLGANALDARAVARVFAAKERPAFDPLIVHLADASAVALYAEAEDADDPRVARLAARFWPGPLTLVLRKRDVIPGIVTAGLPTVGLRVPDHPVARALIRAAGVPVAAPSANRFGHLSPTRAAHVVAGLGSRVDLVLDGGPCRVGVESTVILLAAGRAALLRPGGLAVEAIEAEIGRLEVLDDGAAGTAELAPGRAGAHYAPRVPLELADPRDPGSVAFAVRPGERVGLLAASAAGRAAAEAAGGPFAATEVLDPDGDLVGAAARLFDALHALQAADLSRIVAEPVPEAGLGRAVMDRLRRAASDPPRVSR